MNRPLQSTSFLLLLMTVCAFNGGCQTERPAPVQRVHSGGGAEPYFATDVPDDVPPRQSTFARVATNTGSSVSRFFTTAVYFPVSVYKRFNAVKPSDAARKMEDTSSPDMRREGINELVAFKFAQQEPYTRRYRQIGQYDDAAIVRAVALRASNRARDPRAEPVFVKQLSDVSPLVRLEACKALVHLPDMDAITPLIAIMEKRDEDHDVRIAAADALKHYRTPTVARELVSVLNERDFGIAWQSRQSLRYLTDADYRFDQGAWLTYLAGPDKPLG